MEYSFNGFHEVEADKGLTLRELRDGADFYLLPKSTDLDSDGLDAEFEPFEESVGSKDNIEADTLLPVLDLKSIESKFKQITNDGKLKKFIIREGVGITADEGSVFVHYVSYANDCPEPFDSTHNRGMKPLKITVGNGSVYDGFEMAVKTMRAGEVSCFLIHPDLAFKELGVPPRIPPNSSIFSIIELMKIGCAEEQTETDNITDKRSFQDIIFKIKALLKRGNEAFRSDQLPNAKKAYRRAENLLFTCRLQNDQEELYWKKLLMKVYLNLTVCYNNEKPIPNPKMVCVKVQEAFSTIPELSRNNHKILFQFAKAKFELNDLKEAKKLFERVKKLEGKDPEMKTEKYLIRIEQLIGGKDVSEDIDVNFSSHCLD